jgi:hypothetical protein
VSTGKKIKTELSQEAMLAKKQEIIDILKQHHYRNIRIEVDTDGSAEVAGQHDSTGTPLSVHIGPEEEICITDDEKTCLEVFDRLCRAFNQKAPATGRSEPKELSHPAQARQRQAVRRKQTKQAP